MRRLALLAAVALVAPGSAWSAAAEEHRQGSVYARVTADSVVLGNSVAERRWSRASFGTTALVDKRGHVDRVLGASRDFALTLGAGEVLGSDAFTVSSVSVSEPERGGLRVSMTLTGVPGVAVTRVVEAYGGVA